MNSLQLDELIASLSIPELLELVVKITDELQLRYMNEAGRETT